MSILLPVGRMIGGSLEKLFPRKDNVGNPVYEKGTNIPQMRANFGVAIPKGPEQHWNQTAWGSQIYSIGVAAFPNTHKIATFAWKVKDGDSQIPNKKGNRPCDQEGHKGHWVLWFSQGWLPKKTNANGSQELTDPRAIIPGYYIQVYFDCTGNNSTQSPGVYLNPIAVALSGYGEPIATESDVDTTTVGFGGPLPAGATSIPLAGMASPAPLDMPPPPPPVVPAPDFLKVPPRKQLTPKAGSVTYDQMIAVGWTDKMLIEQGYMLEDIPF